MKGAEGSRPGQHPALPRVRVWRLFSWKGRFPRQALACTHQDSVLVLSFTKLTGGLSKRSCGLAALRFAPGSLSTLPGFEQSHLGFSTWNFPTS